MGVIKHHVEQYPGDQFVMDKKDNRTKISSEITGRNSFQRSSNRQTCQTLTDDDDDDNDGLNAF